MALFHVNFFSTVLCFNTDVNVIIPTPDPEEIPEGEKNGYYQDDIKYETLYLLHGAHGDYSDWVRFTGIERYAHTHKLAVVMPSAANSFYQDMVYGSAYLEFLTVELPTVMEKMFPLSEKREERFIAGLSMGGYGALKIAFRNPERFAACASLSGAVDIAETVRQAKSGKLPIPFRWESMFEAPEKLEGTDADLFTLIKRSLENGAPVPKVFLSCGREDFMYEINKKTAERWKKLGLEYRYEEREGIHDWDYWDANIKRVLEWLHTEKALVEEK